MLKEVVIEDEVVGVICLGELHKGNINNRENMEDRTNNMVVVSCNLIKQPQSSMTEIITTKDYRAHPQVWKYTTIGTTVIHTDLM